MKTIFALIVSACFLTSCVQPSYEQTINITLDVSKMKDIKTVGLRSGSAPFSWDEDFPLKEVIKDSLYSANIKVTTGYKFVECKFTVNGEFEFQNEDNRRVYFDESKVTNLKLEFNKR
jgi:putative oxidoreductase